ncbi:unnamed protein product [Ectocarpus sp. 12 AP-2014]
MSQTRRLKSQKDLAPLVLTPRTGITNPRGCCSSTQYTGQLSSCALCRPSLHRILIPWLIMSVVGSPLSVFRSRSSPASSLPGTMFAQNTYGLQHWGTAGAPYVACYECLLVLTNCSYPVPWLGMRTGPTYFSRCSAPHPLSSTKIRCYSFTAAPSRHSARLVVHNSLG